MTTTDPHIEHRREQPYIGIPKEATLAEWEEVNALVGELLEWIGRSGEMPAGAPFYQYRVMGDETAPFELEVGVPTEGPLSGDDRVRPGTVPSGTYAVTVHEGHPDGLDRSHATLQEWASREGHEIAREGSPEGEVWEGRYESFLTDPEEEPDRSQWSTEIAYLLRDDFPEDLSAPTLRALAGAGYSRLDQLDGADAAEIESLHGIGPAVIDRLDRALADEGLGFADGGA